MESNKIGIWLRMMREKAIGDGRSDPMFWWALRTRVPKGREIRFADWSER